jgi:hypothetical protein
MGSFMIGVQWLEGPLICPEGLCKKGGCLFIYLPLSINEYERTSLFGFLGYCMILSDDSGKSATEPLVFDSPKSEWWNCAHFIQSLSLKNVQFSPKEFWRVGSTKKEVVVSPGFGHGFTGGSLVWTPIFVVNKMLWTKCWMIHGHCVKSVIRACLKSSRNRVPVVF